MELKPCPHCDSNEISVELKHDCYSSWAVIECKNCFANLHMGTDPKGSAFPNPRNDWKEKAISFWNDDNQEIDKTVVLKKKRGENNNE